MFATLLEHLTTIISSILNSGWAAAGRMIKASLPLFAAIAVVMLAWKAFKWMVARKGASGDTMLMELVEFLVLVAIYAGLIASYPAVTSLLLDLFAGIASAATGSPPVGNGPMRTMLGPIDQALIATVRTGEAPSFTMSFDAIGAIMGYYTNQLVHLLGFIIVAIVGAILIVVFLSGKVMLALGVAIGPIFIAISFFTPTRSFLDSWLKYMFCAGLVDFVVTFLGQVVADLMTKSQDIQASTVGTGSQITGALAEGVGNTVPVLICAVIALGIVLIARNSASDLVRGFGSLDMTNAMVGGAMSVMATAGSIAASTAAGAGQRVGTAWKSNFGPGASPTSAPAAPKAPPPSGAGGAGGGTAANAPPGGGGGSAGSSASAAPTTAPQSTASNSAASQTSSNTTGSGYASFGGVSAPTRTSTGSTAGFETSAERADRFNARASFGGSSVAATPPAGNAEQAAPAAFGGSSVERSGVQAPPATSDAPTQSTESRGEPGTQSGTAQTATSGVNAGEGVASAPVVAPSGSSGSTKSRLASFGKDIAKGGMTTLVSGAANAALGSVVAGGAGVSGMVQGKSVNYGGPLKVNPKGTGDNPPPPPRPPSSKNRGTETSEAPDKKPKADKKEGGSKPGNAPAGAPSPGPTKPEV